MSHGGQRTGAGRKKKETTDAISNFASEILDDRTEQQMWKELLTVPDFRIRLDAMKYLCDQKHGRAPQTVRVQNPGAGEGLEFGRIPMPSGIEPRSANKPN